MVVASSSVSVRAVGPGATTHSHGGTVVGLVLIPLIVVFGVVTMLRRRNGR